ncbi:L-rhamnose mutarotase [Lachnellula arida]|uniref:L-rhamnose mutarotase n=2 Tax=Lachnellula TaxID=47830 RepID=A0A8T9B575_9HELO|nr:L-rhamnose mutarotase [Lachnellula arida]TVY93455.1 L-rhamnose mutarotase [Lachnellula willkommii]
MDTNTGLWSSAKDAQSGMWSLPTSPTSPTAPGPAASALPPTYRLKNQGRRVAQIVKLKPECVEAYKECHAKVWPEVLKQIKDCNIEDYSIFHDPTSNILFASFKYVGYNWAGDMERMRENPKVQEWWRMTDGYQESMVEGAKSSIDGEPAWWRGLEEVFYTP